MDIAYKNEDMPQRWVLFSAGRLLVSKMNNQYTLPTSVAAPYDIIGEKFLLDAECVAGEIAADQEISDCYELMDLRSSYSYINENEYRLAGKGWELIYWDNHTQYCGDCGSKMVRHSQISKICKRCGREIFPQLSPAVLVLVKRDDEVLLVHARNFKRPFFGLVAGFVETGESLEQCVAREVMEETSLKVKNIRYYGSQEWPYPANLMIGFVADYESGELTFLDHELSEGGFYSRENLPMIPGKPSLARMMIDSWIEGKV